MNDSAAGLRFFVIGAMKAGTTSIFEYLRQHPRVYIPPGKEVPYFSSAELERRYPGGWQQYVRETFSDVTKGSVCGTVTPSYMIGSLLGVSGRKTDEVEGRTERIIPERIRATCPDARLIAILRDPLERAYSHYQMQVLRGEEFRPFSSLVTHLLQPEVLECSRRLPGVDNTYIMLGEYGRILSAYYEIFPHDQILIVFTEDLEKRPQLVTRLMFEHIGVDPDFVPTNIGVRYLPRADKRRIPWLDLAKWQTAAANNGTLRSAWRKVPQRARRWLLVRYNVTARRAWVWNRIPADRDDAEMVDETAAALSSHYAADLARLEAVIGQPVPWRTSSAAESGPTLERAS